MDKLFHWYLVGLLLVGTRPGWAAQAPGEHWYRSPTLSVMTGFIKDPRKPYTIQAWEKNLGKKFDADRWVADFKALGASYLIFYAKWSDGYCFFDTKTTGYKTRRDFCREIAQACRRQNIKLIWYFNSILDANPEFDAWVLRHRNGKPIQGGGEFPMFRFQTLHSPYRTKCLAQVRELLGNYGRVDGMWLDIFNEWGDNETANPWRTRAYERMAGAPFETATPAAVRRFNSQTLAGFLDETRAIGARFQQDCVWTANSSSLDMKQSDVWAKWVAPRLDYLSVEGHAFPLIDERARLAWILPKPTEIGLLSCADWYAPLENHALPPRYTIGQTIAATAIGVCQGASIYFALAPDHAGHFGEDLQHASAAGAWFKSIEPVLREARPYADVAIVLGSPSVEGSGLPAANTFWNPYEAKAVDAWTEAVTISTSLEQSGIFSQMLLTSEQGGNWPSSLDGFRAIVIPELAVLDEARLDQIRQYVKRGGRVIAFGHASMLDENGAARTDYALVDVLGARYRGEVEFPPSAHRTLVRVDSAYSPQFSGEAMIDNLTTTSWCSDGGPMPHWAEFQLPTPATVVKVELANRPGMQVTDVDVETSRDGGWKTAGRVRGARQALLSLTLAQPVKSNRFRVKILRELHLNMERSYADMASICLCDKEGRNWASRPSPLRVAFSAPEVMRAFAGKIPGFPAMVVRVEPEGAEVLATLDKAEKPAAILRHRFGKGEALLITTSDAAFQDDRAFWMGLARMAAGEPTISSRGLEAGRYRMILTLVGHRHVLHVIDSRGGEPHYPAADIEISINAKRLGGLRKMTQVGTHLPLQTREQGSMMTFMVRPDPVVSVLME